jgi:DNA-binding beta-propeller fold protein YncE
VNVRSNDEAWVANEVSDSVSIVSVVAGGATATLQAKDEPAHVVFANGRAFVSCGGNSLVRVFDIATLVEIGTIPIAGERPQSLAVATDQSRVYAAVKYSGNGTTMLPPDLAPLQPAPWNPALPAPPQTGLIVEASDPRLNPAPIIPDNDVAEIDPAGMVVSRYFNRAGTIHFWIGVHPANGDLWTANTEARNLVRFEPVLNGYSVDNRLTRITPATGSATVLGPRRTRRCHEAGRHSGRRAILPTAPHERATCDTDPARVVRAKSVALAGRPVEFYKVQWGV